MLGSREKEKVLEVCQYVKQRPTGPGNMCVVIYYCFFP